MRRQREHNLRDRDILPSHLRNRKKTPKPNQTKEKDRRGQIVTAQMRVEMATHRAAVSPLWFVGTECFCFEMHMSASNVLSTVDDIGCTEDKHYFYRLIQNPQIGFLISWRLAS